MRILHVINTYLPVRNGVTVSVAGWVDAQAKLGHAVGVWTVSSTARAERNVYAVKGMWQVAHGFPLPSSTAPPKQVSEQRWDVVHTHHPVLLGASAARLARRNGALFAATVHSDYVGYVDSYAAPIAAVARPVVRARMRRFFGSVDAVFVPSDAIERAVRSWGVSGDFACMTYPVDVDALAPSPRDEARAALGIERGRPLAVYAGRLAADKQAVRLIEEFAETLRAVPGARLVMVGGGPLEKELRDRAAPLGGSVALAGELGPRELGRWYSAADVFVSASPNEVGPLALIEAGLCHTAAVAQRVPGFADRIRDGVNGLLAETIPGALGTRLGELLADLPRAHAMGDAAAASFAEHTPEGSARSLIAGYEWAMERSSRRSAVSRTRRYRPRAERS